MSITKSLLQHCPLFSLLQRWLVKTLLMLDNALQTTSIFELQIIRIIIISSHKDTFTIEKHGLNQYAYQHKTNHLYHWFRSL